ncbi:hypothetical protein SORBI_3001G240850 [Sorghum bicolor]|uniref:Uncharacterized protein n=1 Tax=Sorghum bicolor TaxID=4558 RepID=A0A1B6QKQ3_SORBI|nr:hypothetical protein SORBI_3001G240850 [Sorghum bicolor]
MGVVLCVLGPLRFWVRRCGGGSGCAASVGQTPTAVELLLMMRKLCFFHTTGS